MELLKKTIFALVVAVTMAQSAEAVNLGELRDVVTDSCRAAAYAAHKATRWVCDHKFKSAFLVAVVVSKAVAVNAVINLAKSGQLAGLTGHEWIALSGLALNAIEGAGNDIIRIWRRY